MWWITTALAAPPTAVVHSEAIGVGDIEHLEASDDLLAFHTGSNLAYVYDTDSWSAASADVGCSIGGLAFGALSTLYAVCEDGTVTGWSWDGSELVAVTNDSDETALATIEDEAIKYAAWSSADEQLLVVGTKEGEFGQDLVYVHNIDVSSGEVDGGSWPVVLGYDNFTTATADDTRLYISHGQDDVTVVTMATGALAANTLQFGGLSVVDLTTTNRGSAVAIGSQGVIAELSASTLNWIPWMYTLENDSSAVALAATEEDPWLLHAYGSTVDVWDAPGASAPSDTEPLTSIDLVTDVARLIVGPEGYAFAGSAAGEIMVLTANPWVGDASVSPSLIADGQTSTLSFTVDTDGDYTIALGGTRDGSGETLATGEASAGDTVEVALTADGSYSEGDNAIWVFHESANNASGHAKVLLGVDNPPSPISFPLGALGFGNHSLVLAFDGVDDEDLAEYRIYVSTEDFAPGDYPTGGPDYVGPDDFTNPLVVVADPGVSVSQRISGLTNGTTYTVAVRAVDAGGLEGPMSDTLQGIPRAGLNASGLAGDAGGPLCATGGMGRGLGLLGGAGLLAGLLRRRRHGAMLAMLGAALVGPHAATAADDSDEEGSEKTDAALATFKKIYHLFGEDQTSRWATVEVRYGNLTFEDPDNYVPLIYSETNNDGLYLDFGPQIFQVLELKAGFGFYQDTAWTLDVDSGERTADRTMLTWAPFTLSGTLRLHLFDEQPIVPFATFGIDHLIWREKADDGEGGKTQVQGAYRGTHRAYGLNVLLDVFAPRRAGLLEAQSGVNDTWVVLEWRDNQTWERVVDPDEGDGEPVAFDPATMVGFQGSVFTAGLKLDF